jgi:hypothetical protein
MAKRIRIAGADITLASMSADEKRQLILAARFAVRHNRGGWDEAKRQIRVARRLFDAEGTDRHWKELTLTERRPYIDRACQGGHAIEQH